MSFDPDDPRLTAYALGELDPADRAEVESLLASNPEAARLVDEVRELAAVLTDSLRDEPSPGLSIVHRIELDARARGPVRHRGRSFLVAVAAGVLLGFAGFGVGRFTAPAHQRVQRAVADGLPELALSEPEPKSVSAITDGPSSFSASSPDNDDLAVTQRDRPLREESVVARAAPEKTDRFGIAPGPSVAGSARGQAAQELPGLAEGSGISGSPPQSPSASPSRRKLGRILTDTPTEGAESDLKLLRKIERLRTEPSLSAGASVERLAESEPPSGSEGRQGRGNRQPGLRSRASEDRQRSRASGESVGESVRLEFSDGAGGFPAQGPSSRPSSRHLEAEMGRPNSSVASDGVEPDNSPTAVARLHALGNMFTDPADHDANDSPVLGLKPVAEQVVANRFMDFKSEPAPRPQSLAINAAKTRAAAVDEANVIEVYDVAEGGPPQRLVHDAPVRGLAMDPMGDQLVSTSDRSIHLWDLNAGRLVNSLKVENGPVPGVGFGPENTLILESVALHKQTDDDHPSDLFLRPEHDPKSAVPLDIGTITPAELGHRLEDGRLPMGGTVPVAALINTPAYPTPSPDGDEAVAMRAEVALAPWQNANRIVWIGLKGREADHRPNSVPGAAENDPVVVADQARVEVEFNPACVRSYRLIGLDDHQPVPLPIDEDDAGTGRIKAGQSITVLYEVVPRPAGIEAPKPSDRFLKYQRSGLALTAAAGRPELLTVTLSYQIPESGDRHRRELSVADKPRPMAQASDSTRLAASLAWLGLALRGSTADPAAALDGASALLSSCDEDLLPEFRREIQKVIDQARTVLDE